MINRCITFNWQHPAIAHLTKNDCYFKSLIILIGEYTLELRVDYFGSLIKSVVGQQLSSKAANTIRGRLISLCDGNLTPNIIRSLTDEQIRLTGVSSQKIKYIRCLTNAVADNEINLEHLINLSDEQVVSLITKLNGFGPWTAKMFQIFSLGRLDVLAENDIGLQRAASWLYGKSINSKTLLEISSKWTPYRSVASLYLWEIINQEFISSPCPFKINTHYIPVP